MVSFVCVCCLFFFKGMFFTSSFYLISLSTNVEEYFRVFHFNVGLAALCQCSCTLVIYLFCCFLMFNQWSYGCPLNEASSDIEWNCLSVLIQLWSFGPFCCLCCGCDGILWRILLLLMLRGQFLFLWLTLSVYIVVVRLFWCFICNKDVQSWFI